MKRLFMIVLSTIAGFACGIAIGAAVGVVLFFPLWWLPTSGLNGVDDPGWLTALIIAAGGGACFGMVGGTIIGVITGSLQVINRQRSKVNLVVGMIVGGACGGVLFFLQDEAVPWYPVVVAVVAGEVCAILMQRIVMRLEQV